MVKLFSLLTFILLACFNIFALRRIGLASAPILFVTFNAVMGVGTIYLLDFGNAADLVHFWIISLTAFLYFVSSLFFAARYKLTSGLVHYRNTSQLNVANKYGRLALLWYVISLVVVAFYFYLVGYNVLALVLLGDADDATSLRLAMYSGDQYYAPGYFNQFKNIIFPCSFLVLTTHIARSLSGWRFYGLTALLLIPLLFALMGTGQRAFLVGFLIVSAVYRYSAPQVKRSWSFGSVVLIGVAFFVLFSMLSHALGRSNDAGVGGGVYALVKRLFYDQQYSSVIGFRYVYGLPIQYGAEWLRDLRGLLPGYPGSNLANIIHGIMYGSERGTAPVSLWSSVYHNFGWPGLIVVPSLIAWGLSKVSSVLYASRTISSLKLACYSYVIYILASWVSSGPMQLLNNGLLAALLMYWTSMAILGSVRKLK